jgi:hypothetical protein
VRPTVPAVVTGNRVRVNFVGDRDRFGCCLVRRRLSGCAVRCRWLPTGAGVAAAQGGDGAGAGDGPSHAGQFQALADDRLAACLDGIGADEQAAGPEPLVAHAGALFTSTPRPPRARRRGVPACGAGAQWYQARDRVTGPSTVSGYLVAVGGELRLVALPAGHPRAAVPRIGGQQFSQHAAAQLQHPCPDHRLRPLQAGVAAQRPGSLRASLAISAAASALSASRSPLPVPVSPTQRGCFGCLWLP